MKKQISILAANQGFSQTTSIIIMTVGSVLGASIAPDESLATAPITSMVLGSALTMFPASILMTKIGRRNGFMVGATLAIVGGLLATLAVSLSSFWLLCSGLLFVGGFQGFGQYYRFAASEIADEAFRPKAISLVLTGGVAAAIIGPFLARIGNNLFSIQHLGSMLALALVGLLSFSLLFKLNIPKPLVTENKTITKRKWTQVISQGDYIAALFSSASAYGLMVFPMSITSLAMVHHNHDMADASSVIQLHVLGMFLPSFITGNLISKFGVYKVMFAGLLAIGSHIAISATGLGFASFAMALTLLGIGWNFLFIGGTTLLITTYNEQEKGVAQAINDLTIFTTGLICTFLSGKFLNSLGWHKANLILIPWLILVGLTLIWVSVKRKRSRDRVA